MGFLRGQGATEYLVLLAVVLIVALVSVALLGFFPGMAGDSQRVQSETYWRSASPIAITEWAARYFNNWDRTVPYFRVRNTGAYPIKITGIIGADGGKAPSFYTDGGCGLGAGYANIVDNYYLAPGEEKYFGKLSVYGVACDRAIVAHNAASGSYTIGGATAMCANSSATPGNLVFNSMGFEYIVYIDGQQITKRQIGKQVTIKCGAPS